MACRICRGETLIDQILSKVLVVGENFSLKGAPVALALSPAVFFLDLKQYIKLIINNFLLVKLYAFFYPE